MFDWNLEESKVIPEVTNPRNEVDLSRELFADRQISPELRLQKVDSLDQSLLEEDDLFTAKFRQKDIDDACNELASDQNIIVAGEQDDILRQSSDGLNLDASSVLQQKKFLHESNKIETCGKQRSKMDLYTVQTIPNAHSDSIWVAKFSHCGKYLATGGKDACLKVWRVRDPSEEAKDVVDAKEQDAFKVLRRQYTQEFTPNFSLIESSPLKEFKDHAKDIIDLSWKDNRQSEDDEDHILSCSFDSKVILWSLQSENSQPVQIYQHDDVPSQISFAPGHQETFVSGCLDGAIMLWSLKQKKPLCAHKNNGKISSLCFSPDSHYLVVGLANVGICVLYEHMQGSDLNFKQRIDCRNRRGRYSSGRKVAGITFINNCEFIIATNDSSLRLFCITTADVIQTVKFKGHDSENLQLMPTYDIKLEEELVVAGGEDGRVVVWDLSKLRTDVHRNADGKRDDSIIPTYYKDKERNFESFVPFYEMRNKKICQTASANIAIFAPDTVVSKAARIFKD